MPVMTWKRAIAIAAAIIAAGGAVFGLASGSMVVVASSLFLGGGILLMLVIGVYRRIGYQIMLSGLHGQQIESIEQSVRNISQSNLEIRRAVREAAAQELRTIVLGAFRDIVVKVENLAQRLDAVDGRFREVRSASGQLSKRLDDLRIDIDDIKASSVAIVEEQKRLKDMSATSESVEQVCRSLVELTGKLDARIKHFQKDLDKGVLRFSLVNDILSLAHLEKQLQVRTLPPAFSSWTLEPAPLARIVEIVLRERPGLIVECGSGLSTVVLAYAAERVGGRVVALEHLAQYAEETRSSLRRHGLEQVAQVREAVLEQHVIGGQTFDWYAKHAWSDLKDIDHYMVDGPPQATGELARYPAIPLLAQALSKGALVVIDDTHREDERTIVERWQKEFVQAGKIFDLGASTSAFRWGQE